MDSRVIRVQSSYLVGNGLYRVLFDGYSVKWS